MRLKIIMDNGKEYFTEKYNDVEEIITKTAPGSWVSVDADEKIYISGQHVSSIEVVDELEQNDDDELVYY